MSNQDEQVVFDEDSPEWTEAMFAKARPANEVLPPAVVAALVRQRGRPPLAPEARKQKVNIRLSPDVVAALRAGGSGWQRRADELLRAGLRLPSVVTTNSAGNADGTMAESLRDL